MERNYKVVPWICFVITLIVFVLVWINAHVSIMAEEPNVTLSFVLITATVFVNALILSVLSTACFAD